MKEIMRLRGKVEDLPVCRPSRVGRHGQDTWEEVFADGEWVEKYNHSAGTFPRTIVKRLGEHNIRQ